MAGGAGGSMVGPAASLLLPRSHARSHFTLNKIFTTKDKYAAPHPPYIIRQLVGILEPPQGALLPVHWRLGVHSERA